MVGDAMSRSMLIAHHQELHAMIMEFAEDDDYARMYD